MNPAHHTDARNKEKLGFLRPVKQEDIRDWLVLDITHPANRQGHVFIYLLIS